MREVDRVAGVGDSELITRVSGVHGVMKRSVYQLFFAMSTVFLLLSGNSFASWDALVGTYSVEENGQLYEELKIEKQNAKYFVFRKYGGKWSNNGEVTPATKEELEEALMESMNAEFIGLKNHFVALYLVPKGWKSGRFGFESKTGYWVLTIVGPFELHKK